MKSETLHMTIDPDFLNETIENLVSENKLSSAYKIAESCLGNDDLSEIERRGLILGLMDGEYKFAEDEENNLHLQNCSTEHPNLNIFLTSLENLTTSQEKLKNQEEKFRWIVETLFERNPDALRKLCIDYMIECGDYFVDDEVSIPSDIINECKAYPGCYDPWGKKNLPKYADEEIEFENESITSNFHTGNANLDSFLEAQTAPSDPEYGWLSPEGEFHQVEWGEHTTWAREYLESQDIDTGPFLQEGDTLSALGWILIHSPFRGIGEISIPKNSKPTVKQKQFLCDYYNKWNHPEVADAIRTNHYEDAKNFIDIYW